MAAKQLSLSGTREYKKNIFHYYSLREHNLLSFQEKCMKFSGCARKF